ncbi:hypothetical protein FOZ61_010025 [Perkinsus olseni]|uniref:Uncharacterized protein n=1 Tax=Perkinsus olseni TaxID=32597 RepID=A0A7J6KX61_PEROL|nr:hypothetical protein FOZ61_010025 [Perkinsus olseni]
MVVLVGDGKVRYDDMIMDSSNDGACQGRSGIIHHNGRYVSTPTYTIPTSRAAPIRLTFDDIHKLLGDDSNEGRIVSYYIGDLLCLLPTLEAYVDDNSILGGRSLLKVPSDYMLMVSMQRHYSSIIKPLSSSTHTGDKNKGLIIETGSGRQRVHPSTYAKIVNAIQDVDLMVMLSEDLPVLSMKQYEHDSSGKEVEVVGKRRLARTKECHDEWKQKFIHGVSSNDNITSSGILDNCQGWKDVAYRSKYCHAGHAAGHGGCQCPHHQWIGGLSSTTMMPYQRRHLIHATTHDTNNNNDTGDTTSSIAIRCMPLQLRRALITDESLYSHGNTYHSISAMREFITCKSCYQAHMNIADKEAHEADTQGAACPATAAAVDEGNKEGSSSSSSLSLPKYCYCCSLHEILHAIYCGIDVIDTSFIFDMADEGLMLNWTIIGLNNEAHNESLNEIYYPITSDPTSTTIDEENTPSSSSASTLIVQEQQQQWRELKASW